MGADRKWSCSVGKPIPTILVSEADLNKDQCLPGLFHNESQAEAPDDLSNGSFGESPPCLSYEGDRSDARRYRAGKGTFRSRQIEICMEKRLCIHLFQNRRCERLSALGYRRHAIARQDSRSHHQDQRGESPEGYRGVDKGRRDESGLEIVQQGDSGHRGYAVSVVSLARLTAFVMCIVDIIVS